jgi:hypothetical protein
MNRAWRNPRGNKTATRPPGRNWKSCRNQTAKRLSPGKTQRKPSGGRAAHLSSGCSTDTLQPCGVNDRARRPLARRKLLKTLLLISFRCASLIRNATAHRPFSARCLAVPQAPLKLHPSSATAGNRRPPRDVMPNLAESPLRNPLFSCSLRPSRTWACELDHFVHPRPRTIR